MGIRPEVWPFIAGATAICGLTAVLVRSGRRPRPATLCAALWLVACAYLLYFFRDPERVAPADPALVVAGADGRIQAIRTVREDRYLHAECVRVSIFLSLFDVHVNRAPISGQATFLGYHPGRRLFTFQDKASDVNQHNAILFEGGPFRCLVFQIVGPVCRRVVYWKPHDHPAAVTAGERIGMMKFGSRLDLYLPAEHVELLVREGDTVVAGQTAIARIRTPAKHIKKEQMP